MINLFTKYMLVITTLFFSVCSLATVQTAQITYTVLPVYNGGSFLDKSLACRQGVNAHVKSTSRILDAITACDVVPSNTTLEATYSYHTASNSNLITGLTIQVGNKTQVCLSGQTSSGAYPNLQCTDVCTAPNVWNVQTQSCANNCASQKGALSSYFSNTASASDQCMNNCVVVMVQGSCGQNASNQTGCYYDGVFSGETCAGSSTATAPTSDGAFDCIKAGKSYAVVNGIAVCVSKGTSGSSPVTDVAKDSKTVTDPLSSSTTTTSTTDNGGGFVTTTQVTKASDGTTSTKTTEQTKTSFCSENPNIKLCKNEAASTFGGSCGSFTCNGDAIQCAIAKKQHQDRCNDLSTDSVSDLGASIINQSAQSPNVLSDGSSTTISLPTTINGASLLPKSGLTDVSMPLSGHSVNLQFSKLNVPLSLAGKFVLAISYLIGAMIIFGRR